jgi:hypothetical protein
MAQEIDINLNVNAEQADKSLGSLKSQLREAQQDVQKLADKFGATSVEAVNAAKKAADLKDRIGDAKSLTEAFNPDAKFKALSASLTGVAGGFSVVTGAMGAFGGESKEVEQTLLKVQSAMAMASGLQAVGESIDSFKQLGAVVKSFTIVQRISTVAQTIFNAVMAANPIGAIVVAVTALIAAGYALIKMFQASSDATQKAEQANKALNKELDNQVKNQKLATQESDLARDAQLGMAKASGKSAAEVRKLAVELANQEVQQKLTNAQTLRAIAIEAIRVAGLEDATDAEKETAKRALKEFNDANDALKTSVLNRRKLLIENKIAETQEQTDATKKANDDARTKQQKHQEDLRADRLKAQEQHIKDIQDFAKQLRDQQIKDGYKAQDDVEAATKANADRLLTEQELAIQKENEAYKIKYDNAVKAGLDTEELQTEHLNNINDINLTAQQNDYANKKEEEDKKANEDIEREQRKSAAIVSFKENLTKIMSGLEETGLAKTKAGQALSKTLALTQIGIDSALAISKASTLANAEGVAAQLAFPTVPGIGTIARVTSYATTALSVFSNLARAKQLLSGGGGGGGGTTGGGGAAPTGGGGGAAPSFNVVGQSGANQIAESIGARESQPMRAYVVGGDVTTQQGLNRGIVENATLG